MKGRGGPKKWGMAGKNISREDLTKKEVDQILRTSYDLRWNYVWPCNIQGNEKSRFLKGLQNIFLNFFLFFFVCFFSDTSDWHCVKYARIQQNLRFCHRTGKCGLEKTCILAYFTQCDSLRLHKFKCFGKCESMVWFGIPQIVLRLAN